MENWVNEITEIKKQPRPIEYAITTIFKNIGKETWLNDPIIKCIFNAKEFNSNNAYHNQTKVACLIYSCFSLLKQEVHKGFEIHLLILMFASLFHNMNHQGGVNTFNYENEKIAIDSMNSFAEDHKFIRVWTKNHWHQLKNMPSWVNIADVLEELILVAGFLDIKEIRSNYQKNAEALWRVDLPLQINKLKQIFLEALLLIHVMPPHLHDFNTLKMKENKQNISPAVLKLQSKEFLQNFALTIYISRSSLKLGIDKEIEQAIEDIENLLNKKLKVQDSRK